MGMAIDPDAVAQAEQAWKVRNIFATGNSIPYFTAVFPSNMWRKRGAAVLKGRLYVRIIYAPFATTRVRERRIYSQTDRRIPDCFC